MFDAIVLGGGRSSRLAGTPKAGLVFRGQTLLGRTVAAAAGARHVVVVGDVPAPGHLPENVIITREYPPYGGPAAGISAGVAMLASLEPVHSEFILVLACDMPDIGRAVPALLDGPSAHPDADGVFAVDDERHPQPLAALYRTEKLRGALADRRRTSTLDGVSVRSLVARLHLEPVTVPGGSTNDVDTWADALRYGISGNSAAGDAGFAETVTAPALSASAPFHSLASDSRPSEEKP